MKIVRVEFSIDNEVAIPYFFDRPYDETKNDQENCDAMLQAFMQELNKGTAYAVMRRQASIDKPIPAIVMLHNIKSLDLNNVAVYTLKEPDKNE